MAEYVQILEQVASSRVESIAPPPAASVVEALLAAEKQSRKERVNYQFEQLFGTWRLIFITGTKSVRRGAGKAIGAGKYIPPIVKIKLSYLPDSETNLNDNQNCTYIIKNQVSLLGLQLCLQGPTKFLPQRNIVAFDFTRIRVELWGVKVYGGMIRGGKAKEKNFYTDSIQTQAFFSYFLLQKSEKADHIPEIIAARGRGGGLAIWIRGDTL